METFLQIRDLEIYILLIYMVTRLQNYRTYRLLALLFKTSHFSLNSKDCSDIIKSLSSSLLLWHVECSIDEILLLVLNFYHLTLDGGLGDELVDEDIPVLTHPVDPVKALPLTRGVPGRVQQQEMIGRGQVEANSTSLNKSR